MSTETVNTDTAPIETAPVVVDAVVQNTTDTAPAGVVETPPATNPFDRFKEFGVETPDDLYTRYADLNQKVPTLEQKVAELSSADPFATPALKVVNDYQRALIAQGVTDVKEISRLSNEMIQHLQTNYSDLAASDPARIIEMKIRSEFAGIDGITEDEIAAAVYDETFVVEPAKPDDPDDQEEVAAYNRSMVDYKRKLSKISTSAKAYAAQLEKDKAALDFTPRVDPEAQAKAAQAQAETQTKYNKLLSDIANYKIPESINIGGKDIPIENTPELQQMLQDMSKAPLKVIGEYLQMDGEVANFNKAMELSMLIHHLPKIVEHYEAKATDSATRAMEANLQGSLHTGSGAGGGGAALSAEEKATKGIGFLFGA